MIFWRTIVGLLRRKTVGIPVLCMALILGGATYFAAPTRYLSSELFVLTSPASGGTVSTDPNRPSGLTNPLLNFGTGLQITSGILIQAVNTPAALSQLSGNSETALTIDDGRTNPNLLDSTGPFIYVVANSRTAAGSLQAISATAEWLRNDLLSRQQAVNAPAGTYIELTQVVAASTPQASSATKLKYGAAAFLFVFIFGLGLAYAIARRRNRAVGRSSGADESEPEADGSSTPSSAKHDAGAGPTAETPRRRASDFPGKHGAADQVHSTRSRVLQGSDDDLESDSAVPSESVDEAASAIPELTTARAR